MIADAAAAGARLVVLTEMFVDRVLDGRPSASPSRSTARARSSSSSRRAAHGVWVCGSVPERASAGRRAARRTRPRARRLPTARCTATARSTRSPTRASTSSTRRATSMRHRRRRGRPAQLFVCYDLRFADEFWALAPRHRLLRGAANWPAAAARPLAHAARAPGRSRTRRTSWASTASGGRAARLRGRQLRSSARSARCSVDGAGGEETVLLADVDPAVVATTRERYPFLDDRRIGLDWRSSRRSATDRAARRSGAVVFHPMCGCLVAIAAMLSPRFAIFLVWLFGDRMTIAFNSGWIAIPRVRLPAVDDARLGGCLRAASKASPDSGGSSSIFAFFADIMTHVGSAQARRMRSAAPPPDPRSGRRLLATSSVCSADFHRWYASRMQTAHAAVSRGDRRGLVGEEHAVVPVPTGGKCPACGRAVEPAVDPRPPVPSHETGHRAVDGLPVSSEQTPAPTVGHGA